MRKQMRRALAAFLAVVLTVTAQPALIKAAEDDPVSVSFDAQTATLTLTGSGGAYNLDVSSYAAKTKNIVVGEGITSLEDEFFKDFRLVTEITLPSSLTWIGLCTFEDCKSLTDISLPDGLSSIGGCAFWGCTSLTDITIPDSVTRIENGTFGNCTSLKSIHLPSRLTKLGADSFRGCTSLIDVTIPDGVTEIEGRTFQSCTSLKSIHLPSQLSKLGEAAFWSCTSLTDVTIPDSVWKIGNSAFWGCTSLTDITIPDSVTELGEAAFCGCTSLTDLTIPDGVTEIEQGAFENCSSLKSIHFPSQLTKIGKAAFSSCTALTDVTIPDSVTEIEGWAFENCTSLESIHLPSQLMEIGEMALRSCTALTDVTIPDSVSAIGSQAFGNCTSLKSVHLPAQLTQLGSGAFNYCDALTDLTIPDGIIEIKERTFENCSSLKSIHLPSGLTKIGEWTFNSCTSLIDVTIPDSVTEIKKGAFSGCYSLEFIHLPAQLTEIGENVFESYNSPCIFCHNAYTVQYCKDNNLTYIDNVNPLDVNQANIILSGKQFVYTGKEIKPAILLSFDYGSNQTGSVQINSDLASVGLYQSYPLKEGEDYTLSYQNNTECGTASVTVTGIGIYTGSKTIEYEIYKEITGCDIQQEYTKILYSGEPQRPAITVKDGDATLVENKDYSLTYQNNVNEGTATVLVRGMGIYKGEKKLTFTIYKLPVDSCSISQEYTEIVYDGSEKKPTITVKDAEGNLLTENEHYTLIYENTTNPGTATVFVRGIGIYKSEKQLTYTIEPIDIEPADVKLDETIFTYDGSPKKPQVVVTLAGNTLTQDVDFTLSYENNITEGTAHAVIQGIGHYKGTVKMTFTIVPYGAGGDSVYDKDNTLISNNMIYTITDDEENEIEVTSFSDKKLTNLVIPATVKSGDKEYKVTSIGQKAFYKNTKLKSITIGNNITSIEDYAFYGCKNVTSIKMGKSVEIIGASSFRKCTKLTSIVLPKSIDELGKNAFYGCKKLKTITILADSVVDVSENAIKGISQRAVIKVPKKLVKGYKKELKGKTGFKKTMKLKKK